MNPVPDESDTEAVASVYRWLGRVKASRDAAEPQPALSTGVECSALFWPEFIEADGGIFLREHYESHTFRQWAEALHGDTGGIERAINHVHLWDVFAADDAAPEEVLLGIAHIMARTWRCALKHCFPSHAFEVSVTTGECEYGPTVSFSRSRTEAGNTKNGLFTESANPA